MIPFGSFLHVCPFCGDQFRPYRIATINDISRHNPWEYNPGAFTGEAYLPGHGCKGDHMKVDNHVFSQN